MKEIITKGVAVWSQIQEDICNCLIWSDMNVKDLMIALKKPKTTLVDNCAKLVKMGRIEAYSKHMPNFGKGRPMTYWRLKQ